MEQIAKDLAMDRIRRKIEEEADFKRKLEKQKQREEDIKRQKLD